MTTMKSLSKLIFPLVFLLALPLQAAEPDLTSQVVRVSFSSHGQPLTRMGLVLGDGYVLTIMQESREGIEGKFSISWQSKNFKGELLTQAPSGLTLIKLDSLIGDQIILNDSPLNLGEILIAGDILENGLFLSRKASVSSVNQSSGKFVHNIALPPRSLGAGIFDQCGRLIGINQMISKTEHYAQYALDGHAVKAFLAKNKIRFKTDKSECKQGGDNKAADQNITVPQPKVITREVTVTDTDALQREANKREALKGELENKQQALTETQEKLGVIEAQAKQADQARQDAEKKRQQLEEKLSALQEESSTYAKDKESIQKQLTLAKEEQDAAFEKFKKSQQELESFQQKSEQLNVDLETLKEEFTKAEVASKQKLQIFGMIGLGFLTILTLVSYVLIRKRKRQAQEADEKREVAEAEAEAIKAETERQVAPFELHLNGRLSDGKPSYLKIDKKLLGQDGGVVFGRNPNQSDVLIEDEMTGRQHAIVEIKEGELFIHDLGSTNGTQLNNELLSERSEVRVHDGDNLVLGMASYTVTIVKD